MTTVLLDISRLCLRAHHAAPSGIDRVELAYARWALARDPARTGFVVTLPHRLWLRIPRPAAERLVAAVTRRWRGGWTEQSLPAIYGLLMLAALIAGLGRALGLARKPEGAVVYVNVSHHMLHKPGTLTALLRFHRARFVAMVHDLIPITHPEYARPAHARRHRGRLETVARLAAGILVNSETTLHAMAQHDPKITRPHVAPLGLEPSNDMPPAARDGRYFLCLGTIEPRKNHLLLLHLWREMATSRPAAVMPRLLVVGRRGWENEMIVDLLERCEAIRPFVEERNHVADGELAGLLRGACALLMPSFAEGFGLPVAEALAAGVPVICSDIPAHREVGGSAPDYLDPLDAAAWRAAIDDYASPRSQARSAQQARIARWRAPDWQSHFAIAAALIEEVASGAPSAIATARP